MTTRFSPLVKIKKDMMEKCERELQHANHACYDAEESLSAAYTALETAQTPVAGTVSDLLQSRTILTVQRHELERCKATLEEARRQVAYAKAALRQAAMEYEKFEYLETEQIRKMVKREAHRTQQQLDEMAVQGYYNRQEGSR